MSRGGSRCSGDRSEFNNPQQVGPDGWAVTGSGSGPPHPPPKAGDLSRENQQDSAYDVWAKQMSSLKRRAPSNLTDKFEFERVLNT